MAEMFLRQLPCEAWPQMHAQDFFLFASYFNCYNVGGFLSFPSYYILLNEGEWYFLALTH